MFAKLESLRIWKFVSLEARKFECSDLEARKFEKFAKSGIRLIENSWIPIRENLQNKRKRKKKERTSIFKDSRVRKLESLESSAFQTANNSGTPVSESSKPKRFQNRIQNPRIKGTRRKSARSRQSRAFSREPEEESTVFLGRVNEKNGKNDLRKRRKKKKIRRRAVTTELPNPIRQLSG